MICPDCTTIYKVELDTLGVGDHACTNFILLLPTVRGKEKDVKGDHGLKER